MIIETSDFLWMIRSWLCLFNKSSTDGSNVTTGSTAVLVIDKSSKRKVEKNNKNIRGHLLNHMTNSLFDLSVTYKFVIEIWDSLKKIMIK